MPKSDVIYVNAGATAPAICWLDALQPNGRLLFPLTPDAELGGMLLVTRNNSQVFDAKFVCRAMFIPCVGARDPDTANALLNAFGRGDYHNVRSLHRDASPNETCWVSGHDWWLSTANVGEFQV